MTEGIEILDLDWLLVVFIHDPALWNGTMPLFGRAAVAEGR